MASVRFPKIGSIVKLPDGTYSVGSIPGIGGPFDSAADFFKAWAIRMKFPYNENTIRERTPSKFVDEILKSIRDFPLQLVISPNIIAFRKAPFPSSTPIYIKAIFLWTPSTVFRV
jgi:hypothetical protein